MTTASASSVQREPSMEEILASIRKIIEDNESGRRPDPEPGRPVDNTVIEVDAFRAEPRAPSEAPNEGERPATVGRQPAERAAVPAPPQREARAAPSRWAPDAPRPDPEAARVGEASLPGAETAGVGGPAPRAAAPERKTSGEPAGPSASGASAERPAILSEEAERRVAASFGELSEAFAGRSRKTFDELAAEMLGPMLRDWLDENLPGLVERLVREEIQRVARRA